MGKPERMSRMGTLDGHEARQTPCFDTNSFARENNARGIKMNDDLVVPGSFPVKINGFNRH